LKNRARASSQPRTPPRKGGASGGEPFHQHTPPRRRGGTGVMPPGSVWDSERNHAVATHVWIGWSVGGRVPPTRRWLVPVHFPGTFPWVKKRGSLGGRQGWKGSAFPHRPKSDLHSEREGRRLVRRTTWRRDHRPRSHALSHYALCTDQLAEARLTAFHGRRGKGGAYGEGGVGPGGRPSAPSVGPPGRPAGYPVTRVLIPTG
jgi:hypothetical protein